ncbi:hypothetical protein GXW82_09690 [Streptacidiphilus sp. 4-A2]|nr:hypothetical protein [Streptacidiphilus sp. 4-A2]
MIAGTVLAGGMVAATSASAATGGGGCRNGWVGEAGGVDLLPCGYGDGGSGVYGVIHVSDPSGLAVDECAQLLRVNSNGSTTQVADYGCSGWVSGSFTWQTPDIGASSGTYVVQTGFWATVNGNYAYYGGAQSPRVSVS